MESASLTRRVRSLLVVATTLLVVTSMVGSFGLVPVGVAPVGTAAAAPTTISGCTTISSSGAYNLSSGVTDDSNQTCILIDSSDVVLNGQGVTIDGTDSAGTVGINVTAPSGTISNVTVRNVTVTDWETGVLFDSANRSLVSNVNATSNDNGSAQIQFRFGSDNVTIEDSEVHDGGVGTTGIEVDSQDAVVRNNTLTNNTDSIDVNAFGARIVDNDVSGGFASGITLGNANDAFVARNTLSGGATGISASGENVTVRNNTVSGASVRGIEATGGITSLTIVNNEISNAGVYGIQIIADATAVARNNTITDSGGDGIQVETANGTDAPVLTNNTIVGSFDHGIYVNNTSNVVINGTATNVSTSGAQGIEFDSSDDGLVRDVTVYNSTDAGIAFTASSRGNVTNVTVDLSNGAHVLAGSLSDNITVQDSQLLDYGSAVAGVEIKADDSVVRDNTFDGAYRSIFVFKASGVLVEGNKILNGDGTADIYLDAGTTDTRVRNNELLGTSQGIRLEDASNNVVRNNTIESPASGNPGVYVRGTGNLFSPTDNLIVNNTITGAAGTGTLVDTADGTVLTNNTISGSSDNGIFVNNSSNVVINGSETSVTDSGINGLIVTASTDVDLVGGTIAGSAGDGVYYSGSNGTIRATTVRDSGTTGFGNGIEFDNPINPLPGPVELVDVRVENSSGNGVLVNVGGSVPVVARNLTVNGTGARGFIIEDGSHEIYNSTVSNAGAYGLVTSSDGGVVEDTILRDNRYGFLLGGDGGVTRNVTVRNNTYGGAVAGNSNQLYVNLTSVGNEYGLEPVVSDIGNITLRGTATNLSDNDKYGIATGLSNVSLSVSNATIADNGLGAVRAANAGTVTATDVDIGASTAADTTLDFEAYNATVRAVSSAPTPADAVGEANIGRYVNATNTASEAYFDVTFQYEAGDVSGVNESDLDVWSYDGGTWTERGGTLNAGANTINYNATSFSVLAPLAPRTPTNVSGCRVIDSAGLYQLNQSITNSTTTSCIKITASDVTFDGQGYTIDGVDNDRYSTGVNVTGTTTELSNVVVRDVNATGFGDAFGWGGVTVINTSLSNGVDIVGVNASRNGGSGVDIKQSAGVVNITDSLFVANSQKGVNIGSDGPPATLRNNTFRRNGNGGDAAVRFDGDGDYTFVDNRFVNSTAEAIRTIGLNAGDTVTFTNDTFVNSTGPALKFDSTDASLIGTNVTFQSGVASATVDFEGRRVIIDEATTVPADPAGEFNVSQYLNASQSSFNDGYLNVTFRYTDADVSGLDESTLDVWTYENGWSEGGAGPATDPAANRIQFNATNLRTEGRTLIAPLANDTAPVGGSGATVVDAGSPEDLTTGESVQTVSGARVETIGDSTIKLYYNVTPLQAHNVGVGSLSVNNFTVTNGTAAATNVNQNSGVVVVELTVDGLGSFDATEASFDLTGLSSGSAVNDTGVTYDANVSEGTSSDTRFDGSSGMAPDADDVQTDGFAIDSAGGSGLTAGDDEYTAEKNGTLTVSAPGVLSNDDDPNGDSLTASLVAAPSDGTVDLDADGSFEYDPDDGFTGTDTFTYRVTDGDGNATQATVEVRVRNQPPLARISTDRVVEPGETVRLDGTFSSDPNGDPLDFHWNQTRGPAVDIDDVDDPVTTFTAPDVDERTTLGIGLVVYDGQLGAETVVTITVDPTNDPPVAEAGPDRNATAGESVVLDGSASTDPENDSLSYSWTQVGGPDVALSTDGETATFVAPNVSSPTTATFRLTVDDGEYTDADTVRVTIKPAEDDNAAPTAVVGQDRTVLANTTVSLDASNSTDPDGDGLTYQWVQTTGQAVTLSDADTATPTFTAPSTNGTATLSFQVTVDDGRTTATATVEITVEGVIAYFDANDDGEIETEEFQTAIRAWARGEISTDQLRTVISNWVTAD